MKLRTYFILCTLFVVGVLLTGAPHERIYHWVGVLFVTAIGTFGVLASTSEENEEVQEKI